MRRYKKLFAAEELAVEAVIGEPVSGFRIPCSAGKYREMLAFEAGDGEVALAFANQFSAFPTKFPKNRNRELHRLNRELHGA